MDMIASPSSQATPGFAFPRMDLPEKEKDEAWHRLYAMAAIRANLTFASEEYGIINESMLRYNSLYKGEAYKFMQQSEDGSMLPARWIDFNHVNPKVNLLVGDALRRAPKFRVQALNKDAYSRKLAKEGEIRVKMKLRPILEEIEQGTGLNLAPSSVQMTPGVPSSERPMPQTETELQVLMRDNYKGIAETCIQRLLNWLVEQTNWKTKRAEIFMNLPIAARSIVKVEFVAGLPSFREIDPRMYFFDRATTDDFCSDCAYMGSQQWMSQSEVMTRWKLTPKELEAIPRSATALMGTSPWNYTQQINNQIYWLVTDVEWADTKPLRYAKEKDAEGDSQVYDLSPDAPIPQHAEPKENGIYTLPNGEAHYVKRQRTVRRCVMVGDKVVEYGELQNQAKSVDDLSMFDNGYSYVTFLPNWIGGNNVAMVHMMKGIEDTRNIVQYNIQLMIARAGGKVFEYDVSRLPPGMSPERMMHYAKANGIVLYNGAEEGAYGGPRSSGLSQIDLTLSESIGQMFNYLAVLDAQEDQITAVNAARQGTVQSASQAVGVTQSSLSQSNLQTAYMYEGFNKMSEKLFTKLVNMAKVAYTKEEFGDHFSQLFGDAAMAFFREDVNLAMDDYAVVLEVVPDLVSDRGKFEAMVQEGIQMGAIPYLAGMKLLMEPDTDLAMKMLEYAAEKAEAEKRAHEQDMLQRQQAGDGQNAVAQANAQGMGAMQVAQMNNQAKAGQSRLSEEAALHRQNEGKLADLHHSLATKRGQI